MMLLEFPGLKSLFSLACGDFEWGDRSRTISVKGLGNFDVMRMAIWAMIEGRSRKCTLETKYSQVSERGRLQNNNIPFRD